MAIEVSFHPGAVRELRAAFLWYYDRNPIVAQSFQAETEYAIEMVLENPRQSQKWGATERKYVYPHFPFNLIYRENSGHVEVLAVAHQKRKPGYWKKR